MKRVASLNLIASDCGVFLSISSHAARHAIHASWAPTAASVPCFGTGEVLCCVKRSPIGGMRCADGKHGRTEAAKLVRVAEAKLLVLCTHRVDARDIATPLADVIVVLRKVLQHRHCLFPCHRGEGHAPQCDGVK